jgi:alpha 1,3-glucosidase
VEPLRERFPRFNVSGDATIVNQTEDLNTRPYNISVNDTFATLTAADDRLEIQLKPFAVYVSDASGLRLTINPEDTAVFETNRSRRANPELFAPAIIGEHRDRIKNGPTSIALTVRFHTQPIFNGLPFHTLPVNLPDTFPGEPIRLFNLDVHQYDLGSRRSLYGSVPFLLARANPQSDAVFWANPTDTWVDLSTETRSEARFISEGGFMDLYAFTGSPRSILNSYTRLTGRPQLIPLFAFGYHLGRWGYASDEQIKQVSSRLDDLAIPHDAIWLDLEHMDDRRLFVFHQSNWRDIEPYSDKLHLIKRKIVGLLAPYVKIDNDWSTYGDLTNHSLLIRNSTGTGDYNGTSWPGPSSWPDLVNQSVRDWWVEHLHPDTYLMSRANFFPWLSQNEVSVFSGPEGTLPRNLVHSGRLEEREVHNLFGHHMAAVTHLGITNRTRVRTPQRAFVLTRSHFAGTQKYAAVTVGENQATWAHLRQSIVAILSWSISGLPYATAPVGGYFGSPDHSLLTRWYQVAAWLYPIFLTYAHIDSEPREIYTLPPTYYRLAKEAVVERYQLIPYWYTLARLANLTGEPIVRPLWWEFGGQSAHDDLDDAAMVGPGVLVVPFLDQARRDRAIQLPRETRWFEFRSLAEVAERPLSVKFDEGRSGVFVKGGSILPTRQRLRRTAGLMHWDPFTLIVALDANGTAQGELYVDDGDSNEYWIGGFMHRRFLFSENVLRSTNAVLIRRNSGFVQKYDVRLEKVTIVGMEKTPVKIVDRKGVELPFEANGKVVTIHGLRCPIRDDFQLTFSY